MDYFFVADGYANYTPTATGIGNTSSGLLSPGLVNAFIKLKYKVSEKVSINLDAHEFWTQNNVADRSTVTDSNDVLNKRLGTELDLILNWKLTSAIGFEFGYSAMFGTSTLDALKHTGLTGSASKANRNTIEQERIGQWAYVMINIRTDLLADLNLFKKSQTSTNDDLMKRIQELKDKLESGN
jgi:hypothetical protein